MGEPKPEPSLMLQFGFAFTVTVKMQLAELPHASVAGQVIVVTPTGYASHSPWPSLRVQITGMTPSQLSLAVGGVGQTGVPSQTVMLSGQPVNAGAVRSTFHL